MHWNLLNGKKYRWRLTFEIIIIVVRENKKLCETHQALNTLS